MNKQLRREDRRRSLRRAVGRSSSSGLGAAGTRLVSSQFSCTDLYHDGAAAGPVSRMAAGSPIQWAYRISPIVEAGRRGLPWLCLVMLRDAPAR